MNKKVSGILLCAAALLLVSCKNFLKGQETAEQIQAAINYANSDFTLIKVQPQKGTGTVVKPAGGETLQRPSDVFDLVFEPSVDYEFVTWKISAKNMPDGVSFVNCIEIDDPNKAETTVTFRRPLEDIIITPVVVRRPKILSYSPVYTGSLSLKDAKIQVIFDRKMDPSSIYYSPDEINELKAELGLRDQDFLPENSVPGAQIFTVIRRMENIFIKTSPSKIMIHRKVLTTDLKHLTLNHLQPLLFPQTEATSRKITVLFLSRLIRASAIIMNIKILNMKTCQKKLVCLNLKTGFIR